MKKLVGLSLVFCWLLVSSIAFSETWVATCNKVQFNFSKSNKVLLVYFHTTAGIFQIAKGKITLDTPTHVLASIDGNSLYQGKPITQIGLNPSRRQVYVYYKYGNNEKSGDFCAKAVVRRIL